MRQMARQMARYWHGVSKTRDKGTQGARQGQVDAFPGTFVRTDDGARLCARWQDRWHATGTAFLRCPPRAPKAHHGVPKAHAKGWPIRPH
jgi:hypothetical protein